MTKLTHLSMSLKQYLFMLVTGFILLIGLGQILFIDHIEQQLAKEVEQKSLTLSERLFSFTTGVRAVETQTRQAQRGIHIQIESTPHQIIDLGDGHQFKTGDKTKTLRIAPMQAVAEPTHVEVMPIAGTSAFRIAKTQGSDSEQQIIQFDRQASAVGQYFNQLIWATGLLCIAGLAFAFWLARHISQPLSGLAAGFKKLEQGELGSTVTEQGIKEVRETLGHFNQMSKQLAHLRTMEQAYQQREQLAELGEVSRGLAHALRNPLNTIGLAIEQLTQPELAQSEKQQLAQQVQQKIQLLDANIKALLNLTTTGIDRQQPIDINQIIEDVRMELAMASQHSIYFQPKQAIDFYGADSEVRAMLHSLVANAVEASQADQSISIFVTQKGKTVTIEVVDIGSGIPSSLKAQLFQPHVSSKAEGAGMGLYIVKRMSQLYYQGDIQLKDNSLQGTIAILTLSSQDHE